MREEFKKEKVFWSILKLKQLLSQRMMEMETFIHK